MTTPPPEPSHASRNALAAELTRLRKATGLSGNAFGRQIGRHQSRVWKIEHGELLPTADDITAWAAGADAAGSSDRLLELLGEARGEQAFSVEFRKSGGPAAYQDRVRETEQRATRIGEFEAAVIPGPLQTPDYARELLRLAGGLLAWGGDETRVENTVTARMRRQDLLYDPAKRFQFVLGEAALRTLVCSPGTLAGQLGKLLSVSRLPSVELGVIGFGQRMPAYPIAGFRVYDDDLVVVESIITEQPYTRGEKPAEVAAFLEAFAALREAAVTGDQAEAIIQAALESLDV